jgi:hypothetical protein
MTEMLDSLSVGSLTRARSPLDARAYIRDMPLLIPNSSTKTRRNTFRQRCFFRKAARSTGSDICEKNCGYLLRWSRFVSSSNNQIVVVLP